MRILPKTLHSQLSITAHGLKNAYKFPLLTLKVGQADIVFGVAFIRGLCNCIQNYKSRACSRYDLCHRG